MRNHKSNFPGVLIMFLMGTLLVLVWSANAQAQRARAVASTAAVVTQQPLYTDYKGVRLGMTAQEARIKLGEPTLKSDEQDYFVLSDKETAQIGYDVTHKVIVISVDYPSGVGAPDPRAVVGSDLELVRDGSLYKVVRYENQGFWVSYSRTAGPVVIVTITIQKML
jgi:hypothetical protein